MKRIVSVVLVLTVLLSTLLCGCGSAQNSSEVTGETTRRTTTTSRTTTKPTDAPEVVAARAAVTAIKSQLKNPESLQIHSISYTDGDIARIIVDALEGDVWAKVKANFKNCTHYFVVDFSAQNGFGGMNRYTYRLCVSSSYVPSGQFDNLIQTQYSSLYISTNWSVSPSAL